MSEPFHQYNVRHISDKDKSSNAVPAEHAIAGANPSPSGGLALS